jgi:hypothetical protein
MHVPCILYIAIVYCNQHCTIYICFILTIFVLYITYFDTFVSSSGVSIFAKKKVKQSRYSPGGAQRVPRSEGSQIS